MNKVGAKVFVFSVLRFGGCLSAEKHFKVSVLSTKKPGLFLRLLQMSFSWFIKRRNNILTNISSKTRVKIILTQKYKCNSKDWNLRVLYSKVSFFPVYMRDRSPLHLN